MLAQHGSFTYRWLESFLAEAKAKAAIFRLCDWNGQSGLILRHDVDLDIMPAFAMAELEKRLGIRSTFCILVSAPTYNPASENYRAILRRMADDGFEIGLHFDPAIYGNCGRDALAAHMRREAEIVQEISGQPLRSVSLHNPSILGEFTLFDGFMNAYDPRIFGPDRYLSDSCMVFQKDPVAFIECARTGVAQLLLHPFHYSEDGAGYPDLLLQYILRATNALHRSFLDNKSYVAAIKSDGLENLLKRHMASKAEHGD